MLRPTEPIQIEDLDLKYLDQRFSGFNVFRFKNICTYMMRYHRGEAESKYEIHFYLTCLIHTLIEAVRIFSVPAF